MMKSNVDNYSSSAPRTLLCCLLICIVGALAYANALGGSFVYDDSVSLINQAGVKSLDPVVLWNSFNVRMLGYYSFALNYRLTGFDPFWFHLVNVAIHLINGCLVFWLARLVMRRSFELEASMLGDRYGDAVALTAGLIFVAHPLGTQAVSYVVQRLASQAALFYLLAVIIFFKGRILMEAGRRLGAALVAVSLLFAVVAMFTKQNAFTIPLMLLLVEFSFFSPSWRLMKRKAALFAVALALMGVIPVALMIFHGVSIQDIGDMASQRALVNGYAYLATQVNVVRTYLRLLIFPAGLRVDYAYPIFHSLLNERTILSGLVHISLWAIAIGCFKRRRAVFFGIAFFYIALIVESSIFPIRDVIVEHRAYLPSAGIFIAASSLIWLAAKRLHARRVPSWIFVGLLVAVLAVMTYHRNRAWADSLALWSDNVREDPASYRANYNLGKAYEALGDWASAKRAWMAAARLKDSAWTWNNIGNVLVRDGDEEGAERAFRRAVELNPGFVTTYGNLGILLEEKGDLEGAVALNRKALSIDPGYAPAYFNLGRIHYGMKDLADAERYLSKAISLDPGHSEAMVYMALVLDKSGRSEEAKDILRSALAADPKNDKAKRLLRVLELDG